MCARAYSTGFVSLLFLLSFLAFYGHAGEGEEKARTGHYVANFKERHPLSTKVRERCYGKPQDDRKDAYKIEEVDVDVYVPEGYDGSEAYGLYIYISPDDYGGPWREYKDVMDKHKLIYAGGQKIGNKEDVAKRFGVPLDAVHNLCKQYNIDKRRIYISGTSGGGRCASMLGIGFSDVFMGAVPFVGCNGYRDIPIPDNKIKPGFNERPDPKLLQRAKTLCRFVLISGEKDFNLEGTKQVYEDYKRDRFRYIDFYNVSGMGHTPPAAEWLAKAIVFMDAPLEWMVLSEPASMVAGVKLDHFERYAKRLVPGKSVRGTLMRLQKYAEEEDEKGKEAAALIEAVKRYYRHEFERGEELCNKKPAAAVAHLELMADTFKGLPMEEKIEKRLDELTEDKTVKIGAKLREDFLELQVDIGEDGLTSKLRKKSERLAEKIGKLIEETENEGLKRELGRYREQLEAG